MQLISQIKVDKKWVNQFSIPKEVASEIIKETMYFAGRNIGYKVTKVEKTA